jgi:hypothetical protein
MSALPRHVLPFRRLAVPVGLFFTSAGFTFAETESPVAEVKTYLLETVAKMKAASSDFVKNSAEYAAIVAANGGNVSAAYQAEPEKLDALVIRMQDNYKAMDSFGYETVEGIVAGVESLADFDIYLDAGVPSSEGPDDVAAVILDLGNGEKIDREGALFTYIIEPALWGGNEKWLVDAGRKKLPRPEVLVAAAKDADSKISELQEAGTAWQISVVDCFGAMVTMTPTLSDYFEDWKESRFADEKSGRFQAVSRISDMRGIMSSCAVMYKAVMPEVAAKDRALAKSVSVGFDGILGFIDLLDKREKQGVIKEAEIDELAAQAKEKTDKLVPQIEQSAAVAGVKISN